MERAARVLHRNKLSRDLLGDEQVVRSIWAAAVGRVINAHTLRVRVVRQSLVVEVEDAIWQRQLRGLSEQILSRLTKLTGFATLTEVEFRVGAPKRQPQRAQHVSGAALPPAGPPDEADRIQDPVLKKVYLLSRRKALA